MANEKILIVEDEGGIAQVLRYNLEKAGYRVLCCGDGETALALARKERPHAVILDLMIPRLDGLEVCRRLRRDSQVPVLMLTARTQVEDRLLGFETGADDYIAKPFSVAEVLARVKAVLKRSAVSGAPSKGLSGPERIGDLELDLGRGVVRLRGRTLALSVRESALLKLLAEQDGKELGWEAAADALRGIEGRAEEEDVDALAAGLCGKLEHEGARIVRVRGGGYRLRLG